MTEPTRHYHGLHHLEVLWTRHLVYRDSFADEPRHCLEPLVAFAIAYHDAIYVSGDPMNEEHSASLWLEVSATATDLSTDARVWVAETIRATADHLGLAETIDADIADAESAGRFARQWVLDLDLSPLGEQPHIFDENMRRLEAESLSQSREQRRADVLKGLRHFASGDPLFRCAPIAAAFTDAANCNFARHLSRR